MAPTHHRNRLRNLPGFLSAFLVGAALLTPSAVWAGEIKFGAEPLETDDAGKLKGSSKTTSDIASEAGDETWQVYLWAKIDDGAPGPLYVEFFGKLPNGKPYRLNFRHEHAEYQGEKFVNLQMELSGDFGFNKGKTYDVKVVQVSDKGKDLTLATSKLTLSYTEAAPEEPGNESEDDDGKSDEEDDTSAQDEFDTLSGSDPVEAESAGPPAVAPKDKKGCSIDTAGTGFSGVALLLMLGFAFGRRRES